MKLWVPEVTHVVVTAFPVQNMIPISQRCVWHKVTHVLLKGNELVLNSETPLVEASQF
jgi:hypothetical protein